MIELRHLSKTYPSSGKNPAVKALEDVNLTIEDGEIFGIIGLSGAGKSTLVRCVNLLERPTAGRVLIDGLDFAALPPRQVRKERQKIGMIFQQFNLLWSRTVAGNVAFPLEIAGVPTDECRERVAELLELVGLGEKKEAYPAQLSGGQKQRVGIARALANHPRVLLSDEATSALDPETTSSILALLKKINQELGLTVVIITHEMAVIKEICDRVAVIDDSRIVETGTTLELFTSPRTSTAKRFVDSVLKTDLPPELDAQKFSGILVRLTFIGEAAGEPVLSQLVRRFNVDANVLYGNVDHIKDTTFGTLTLELLGETLAVGDAITFLEEQGIKVEVLRR